MNRRLSLLALIVPVALAVGSSLTSSMAQEGTPVKRKVVKTDAEWAKLLTNEQFMVTRRKATEPAFSGKYATTHAKGTFDCVCCGAALFSSQAKFDSGTGWPSFWRPIDPKRIEVEIDNSAGVPREEVLCRDCGAHLGHVFDDGPPPTNLRFCINSASLKLVPAGATATKKTTKGSAKSKTKDKSSDSKTDSDSTESKPAEPKAAEDK